MLCYKHASNHQSRKINNEMLVGKQMHGKAESICDELVKFSLCTFEKDETNPTPHLMEANKRTHD